MTDLRTAAQQALEALEKVGLRADTRRGCDEAVGILRAALAQQADPTDPGNDVDVLREHVRHLERRVRELHAQQAEPVAGVVLNEEGRAALVEYGREEWHCVVRNARRLYTAPPKDKPKPMHPELRKMWEDYFDKCFRAMPVPKQAEPVEPHRWEGDNNIESPFNACMHKTYCMTLKQAEPLNLADPAVQKRLASQWGYVPAAQAEPDVSRCPRCNGPADNGFDRSIPPSPYLCTKCMAEPVEPVEPVEQLAELQAMLRAEVDRLIAAGIQPQRKLVLLTEAEIEHIGITHQSLRQVARAVERAVWEKNHGQA